MMMKTGMLCGIALFAGCLSAADGSLSQGSVTPNPSCSSWPTMLGSTDNGGRQCGEVVGGRLVAEVIQDPHAERVAEAAGFVISHQGSAITQGDYVVVPTHSGDGLLTDDEEDFDRSQVRWFAIGHRWVPNVRDPNAELVPVWKVATGWQPVDSRVFSFGYHTNGNMAHWQPAISGNRVWYPDDFGRVTHVDLVTGRGAVTVDPFAGTEWSGDPRVIVHNALAVAPDGSIWYTVTAWPATPRPTLGEPDRRSWLVNVRADGSSRARPWSEIAVGHGIPAPLDLCEFPFGTGGTGPATGPDSRPPQFRCGPQRPGINAPLAFANGGRTIVGQSRAHNQYGALFLVGIDAETMTLTRAFDTRGRTLHGCGVRFPASALRTCRVLTANGTTNLGVSTRTNGPVMHQNADINDSAVVVDPDGGWTLGGYDDGVVFGGGFDARGFMVRAAADDSVTVQAEFAWEVSPTIWRRPDGSWSFVQDRNFYSNGDLRVASYTPGFELESSGTIADDDGWDFIDANVLVDQRGNRWAMKGTGRLVKFGPDGTLLHAVELLDDAGERRQIATLSGYFASDSIGRVYVGYAGRLYVVAPGGGPDTPPTTSELVTDQLRVGLAAKAQAGPMPPTP